MNLISDGIRDAIGLLLAFDPLILDAALRSVWISLLAVVLSTLVGLPLATLLARIDFPARSAVLLMFRATMAFPTVFVGIVCYALFSRRGPLGPLQLLYTPWAIVFGEFLLALPLIVSLGHGALQSLDPRISETAWTLGAGRLRRWQTYLSEARVGIVLAVLTAFSRCVTELGIAMMVGGNIQDRTRTLATATALETGKGEFARGLATGSILLLIAMVVMLGISYLGSAAAAAATSDKKMIRVENLHVEKNGRTICSVTKVDVSEGERVAIGGCNGSGKTTFLRVLSGLEADYHGQVHVDASSQERTYVHQSPYLFRGTVMFNVTYGLRPRGLHRAAREQAAHACLERLGIDHLSDRLVTHLSGGEIRRVAIARALVLRPRLLLLDEPFADMDDRGAADLLATFQELTDSTILVASPIQLPQGLSNKRNSVGAVALSMNPCTESMMAGKKMIHVVAVIVVVLAVGYFKNPRSCLNHSRRALYIESCGRL